jgi:hypothetical protein
LLFHRERDDDAPQWSIEEGGDLVVDLGAQPADLALRNTGHAHCFDQIIDRAISGKMEVLFKDHQGDPTASKS